MGLFMMQNVLAIAEVFIMYAKRSLVQSSIKHRLTDIGKIPAPYMTVSDWEHGKKRVPKYFLRLLEYYVRMEQMGQVKKED